MQANPKRDDVAMNTPKMQTQEKPELLVVKNLTKYFPVRSGVFQRVSAWVQAVDKVSFAVRSGETLGMVGESGCGKTTVGRSILRLVEPTSGEVSFNGENIISPCVLRRLKSLRRDMQIIFQDPYASPQSPHAHRRSGDGRFADSQNWASQGTLGDCHQHAQKSGT
jgi:ABC-type oligopeptide transport system ATPase subunit